jgi:hypothetical protein
MILVAFLQERQQNPVYNVNALNGRAFSILTGRAGGLFLIERSGPKQKPCLMSITQKPAVSQL